jgi:AcrR family transcriptional regulator
MTTLDTKQKIVLITTHLLARDGVAALSMRDIAHEADVATSVLYYYFADKDSLLRSVFDSINTNLGLVRATLPSCSTASEMLEQRILFQLNHIEEVVAVLKFYLAYRNQYVIAPHGVLPEKAYLHMQEVLEYGLLRGEFTTNDIVGDAQVMTHAVNGFLLEYYPLPLSHHDKQVLSQKLHAFLIRALSKNN